LYEAAARESILLLVPLVPDWREGLEAAFALGELLGDLFDPLKVQLVFVAAGMLEALGADDDEPIRLEAVQPLFNRASDPGLEQRIAGFFGAFAVRVTLDDDVVEVERALRGLGGIGSFGGGGLLSVGARA